MLLVCRYQSLNLTHVPEHSAAIYEFRWPPLLSGVFFLFVGNANVCRFYRRMGEGGKDNNFGWEFWSFMTWRKKIYKKRTPNFSNWQLVVSTRDGRLMNVWMRWKQTKCISVLGGACAVQTNSEDWARFFELPIAFFVLMSGFKMLKLRHFGRLAGKVPPFLVCI